MIISWINEGTKYERKQPYENIVSHFLVNKFQTYKLRTSNVLGS